MRWRRRRSDDDYRAELETHIEAETQANIERGLSPEDARREARVSFGSVAGVRQQLHDGRSGWWLDALASDVRYGVRMIRRNWLLSSVVALTMSIGIGSTTAVFSVMAGMAFAPSAVHDPDSFVMFTSAEEGFGYQVATPQRYEALRGETRSMRELTAWSVIPLAAPLGSTDASKVLGSLVSCNIFTAFSAAPPIAGRFLQEKDCSEAAPVAVMSDRLWRSRFTGDPAVVGRAVAFGSHAITIVGVSVSPPTGDIGADLWLPYTARSQTADLLPFGKEELDGGEFYWLGMSGRLTQGYSRRAAAAEFAVLTGRERPKNPDLTVGLTLTDGSLWSTAPMEALWMFSAALAFPTLVLVIVCATVATLLLSRAVKRQREMAIRLAVGGGRIGLVRMLLVENVLLAVIAALLGLALVSLLQPLILRQVFGWRALDTFRFHLDWRVVAYMALVTFFTAICAGVAPAMESLNLQLGESLKGRLVLGGRRGMSVSRGILVGVQVAFSMVLLVSAVATVRAERWVAAPGFETRQVMFAQLPEAVSTAHTPASLAALVRALPASRAAAYSETLPLVFETAFFMERQGQSPQGVLSAQVSPAYFDTLGIRILSGRPFQEADASRTDGSKPVVVSAAFARRFFPAQNVLGQTIEEMGPRRQRLRFVVVGVAADRATGFGPLQAPSDGSLVYRLMEPALKGHLLVRFDGDARTFSAGLQRLLKDATGWVTPVATLQSRLDLDPKRSILQNVGTFLTAMSAIGLALALIGVFGILAFTAAQRRKEVAIRTALGASRTAVFSTMVLPALRPTIIGAVVGAFLSYGVLRVAESQRVVPFGGLPSVDPISYLPSGLLLLCVALAAMSPPAWRAAVSDPARALRED